MARFSAAVALLLLAVLSGAHAASLTLKSGRVLDLDKIRAEAKGKCCLTTAELGLGKVDGDTTIVRMDGSNGAIYVTNSATCSGGAITSSAYPTSFSNLYLCSQCKGGCPQVEGGKTLVPAGGSCVTSSGSYDISKVCSSPAPVCMNPGSGKCVTIAEATAPTPAPTPKPSGTTCASFANLDQPCDDAAGKCCGGAPKNAKCSGGKCVSTYPSGRKAALL